MDPPAKPAVDKQSLCIDILVSGHVQAYVDFFYLTHRPEVGPAEEEELQEEQVGIPSAMLPLVKTQLAEAEVARRRGDTQAVFSSYKQLADFFTGLADQQTATYFWEKCLEITQLTSDAQGEAHATRSLGMAHESAGDLGAAIKQYEQLLRLTQRSGDVPGEQQANDHLVVAYQAVAAERESAGDLTGAIDFREKCLEASRAGGDTQKESQAQYNLGMAHEKVGDIENLKKAVGHYEQYLSLAEAAKDGEAQGAACNALAQVYQRMQDVDAALKHLQRFLELAQASEKLSAQAEACCSLGVLYNQQNDFASAVQYLERYFELARSIGDRKLVDKARAYLGIARGNSVLPAFVNVVTSDLDALLRWKNRRAPFSDVLSSR